MRRRSIIVVFLAVAVVLLNLPLPASTGFRSSVRDNVAPFQTVLQALRRQTQAALISVWDGRRLALDLDHTREALANARFQLAETEAIEEENRELRRWLDFSRRHTYRLVMCRVVSRGGMGGWWQTIRIDKGRDHGIGENMAVITMDGLVGRTGAGRFAHSGPGLVVSAKTSDVLLITDPGFKVATHIGKARHFGILSGSGPAWTGKPELALLSAPAPFDLDYMPSQAEIVAGDLVKTSGRGGIIPEGLIVGHVQSVALAPSGLYQRATVTPAANVRRLDYVFVVVPDASAPQAGAASDDPEGGQL